MARQRVDEVTIVGVGGRDNLEPMEEFVARHDLGHIEVIADVPGDVWAANGIGGQPAWVFIDGETGAVEKAFGGLGEEGLNAAVDKLSG